MRAAAALIVSVRLLAGGGALSAEARIPCPAALDSAAVSQDRLDDISRRSLVLGNGDLNALLWDGGDALRMRVTKNDLWDARIDTSKDPDLMRMDIHRRTWRGGTRTPPSWHKHPYPQPRCAAVVVIGRPSPLAGTWTCIRAQGTQNDWSRSKGLAVMSVTGRPQVSAGWRLGLDTSGAAACSAVRLQVSGTPNARCYVYAADAAGKELVRSGWQKTPAAQKDVTVDFSARGVPAVLELYVMSTDGKRAENRYHRVTLIGGAKPRHVDLARVRTRRIKSARLDLRRAVATVEGTGGQTSTVRALADRNVFLIRSAAAVSLEEVKAPQLPPAKLGRTDGVTWLHMTMPGDVDYKGMQYALAVAGTGDLKAVAMVTSFDTDGNVLDAAIRLARKTVAGDAAGLVAKHERAWAAFWSAGGVQLGDRFFQDAWYRNLYYMRCFCRPGTTMPITLYAGLAKDRTGWHGAPTLDYNLQQTFWPMFVCNHVDLMEPYVTYLERFAPRGRWLAKRTYGLDGLFYPVNIFGPEHLVAPQRARSRNARQIAYVPWTYGLGLTGWALQNVWLRYKYQPEEAYLKRVYPLLRDGAEFYANVLDQCRTGADGKAEIGPSYNPEHGPFGTYNNPVDITYFRFLLTAAGEAARLLKRDAKLARRWAEKLKRIGDYETTPLDGAPIVANWKGANANSVRVHNVAVPTVPIFPGEQVSWFSPPATKALFERTLRWIRHNGNNSHIMVNVARARLSFPEAYTATRAHFSKIVTPNGLYASWPGHGYYLAESWAFAGLTAELLLQSVEDIVRVFPAWPKAHDATFVTLRAQGGFLISAEQKAGTVRYVRVTSTAGGPLRVLSPWPRVVVRQAGRTTSIAPDKRSILTIDTTAGRDLTLEPAP